MGVSLGDILGVGVSVGDMLGGGDMLGVGVRVGDMLGAGYMLECLGSGEQMGEMIECMRWRAEVCWYT